MLFGPIRPGFVEGATALGPEAWHLSGLTDNYLRVNAEAPRHLWNEITPVRLTLLREAGLQGEICMAGGNS